MYTKWTRQSVCNYRVENELIYVYIRTQDEHRCKYNIWCTEKWLLKCEKLKNIYLYHTRRILYFLSSPNQCWPEDIPTVYRTYTY